MQYLILSLRLYQWSKNLLVFAALIFSGHLFVVRDVLLSSITFLLFCLVAGWIYVVNDIKDVQEDRQHPVKRNRPLAAGKISPVFALTGSTILFVCSMILAFSISIQLAWVLAAYAGLQLLYTFALKHVVILDILVVAIGFVLRAVAGALAISVIISPWLLVCTFFLALFLVVGKRRSELVQLKQNAVNHRRILNEYNQKILDQMIVVVTGATIIGYALYTLDTQTIEKFGTENLIYTVPFVVYGIFRYYYLIYKQNLGGSPEKILVKDKHILLDVLSWVTTASIIIYMK